MDRGFNKESKGAVKLTKKQISVEIIYIPAPPIQKKLPLSSFKKPVLTGRDLNKRCFYE